MPVIDGKIPEMANEPANILYVVRRIAGLLGVAEEKIAEMTCENAARLLIRH
jgi:Tat protein secretion system quality control protein TatD with DNase activity